MIRRKRKFKFVKPIIIFLFFLTLLILLILLFFRSNFLVIKQIEIQGQAECVNPDQLKNAIPLYGQNFFLLNEEKLTQDLKRKYICIKGIIFSRYFPDKMKLEISPRQPVAVLLSLKEKQASASSLVENIATPEASIVKETYVVDNESIAFATNIDNLNIPKIYIFDQGISLGQRFGDDLIGNALKILERIKTFGVKVTKSWISDNFFIINPDTKYQKIVFDLSSPIDIQLASLQLILTEAKMNLRELEFIDLRFDKPVVRYAPKESGYQK